MHKPQIDQFFWDFELFETVKMKRQNVFPSMFAGLPQESVISLLMNYHGNDVSMHGTT